MKRLPLYYQKNTKSHLILSILQIFSLRKSWLLRPCGTYWPVNVESIDIRWCRGHAGIQGNEKADWIAKESFRSGSKLDLPDTIKRVKRKVDKRFNNSRIHYFENNAPQSCRNLELEAKDKTPYTLRLPREALGHLLAARSKHGDFFTLSHSISVSRCWT